VTWTIVFRLVAWLLVVAIVVFTLSPIEVRPTTAAPVSLERFAAFAAIGVAMGLAYPKHRLGILIVVIGLVGVLEVAQNFVPGRHGRLPDGMVKASGALLGAVFTMVITRQKRSV
jgi:Trk-type K+ transport system membrane component